MALVAAALANKIKSATEGIDKPQDALDAFWDAVKNYVEQNAQPTYAWVAVGPPPACPPDPMVTWIGKVKPSGKLSLSNADKPAAACSALAGAMNASIATWMIDPPSGFSVSPMLMMPSIVISPSGATDRDSALLALATNIIAGIQGPHATPATAGTHGSFTGAGTLTGVL